MNNSRFTFGGLVGNTGSLTMLQNAIIAGTLPNFIILSGIKGTGKTSSAQIAALALTCEHPIKANPCCECSTCKANIAALTANTESARVKKINLAQIADKADIQELIKKIFVFSSKDDNTVFILDEAHALRSDAQTCLLTEIDGIPSNVYVIMTTTKVTGLIPDLRSRAVQVPFNRVSDRDMKVLLDAVIRSNNLKNIDTSVARVLIRKAKGVPREMLQLATFIGKTPAPRDAIIAFLNTAETQDFLSLCTALTSDSIEAFRVLDELLAKMSVETFIEGFKEFILSVILILGGSGDSEFSLQQRSMVKDIFTGVNMHQVVSILESLNRDSDTSDLKFAILKMRQLMLKRPVTSMIAASAQDAVVQAGQAQTIANEKEEIKGSSSAKLKMPELSLKQLKTFSID